MLLRFALCMLALVAAEYSPAAPPVDLDSDYRGASDEQRVVQCAGAYLAASRRAFERIETSDASDDLWQFHARSWASSTLVKGLAFEALAQQASETEGATTAIARREREVLLAVDARAAGAADLLRLLSEHCAPALEARAPRRLSRKQAAAVQRRAAQLADTRYAAALERAYAASARSDDPRADFSTVPLGTPSGSLRLRAPSGATVAR